jgi:hypothetical protein
LSFIILGNLFILARKKVAVAVAPAPAGKLAISGESV